MNCYQWLSLTIPPIITITGWIIIYIFNLNAIKKEKKVSIKVEAYNYLSREIKELLDKTDELKIKLRQFVDTLQVLKNKGDNDNEFEEFIKNITEKNKTNLLYEIRNLSMNVEKKTVNHATSWSQYELVFKKFESEKKQIDEYAGGLNQLLIGVYILDDVLVSMGVKDYDEVINNINKTIKEIIIYRDLLNGMLSKMQEYVFEDLF